MRNFLENRMGKEIDVNCGSVSVSGRVTKIEGNVLYLEKDEVTCYVNIDKIVVVWDSDERRDNPPGFVVSKK